MKKLALLLIFSQALVPVLRAELKLPAIIGDHMVLQQRQADPIWGWDTPGTKITVAFLGKKGRRWPGPMKLPFRSPEFKALNIVSNQVTVPFDCFGSKLRPVGVEEANGFAVRGADNVWHWATGKVIGGNQIALWSDEVAAPVAVRYAWADNPVCNLFSSDGLPVTPFRTDGLKD